MAKVIGWNTHKVADGYEWRVYSVEHAQPLVTLKSGLVPTYAKAVARAKMWTMYHRSQQ